MVLGAQTRDQRQMERTAWHASLIMNRLGKPAVSWKRLLGMDRVFDNEAIAAFVGAQSDPPKSKKQEDDLSRREVNEKIEGFKRMMRRKAAEAKAEFAAKKASEKG